MSTNSAIEPYLRLMTGFVELEALRKDDEFVLQRCEHSNQPGSPSVLLLAPASTRPMVETLKKARAPILVEGSTGFSLGGSAPDPCSASWEPGARARRP